MASSRFFSRFTLSGLSGLALLALSPSPVVAFEAVTTQAGLSEQAGLASRLHRRLIQRFVYPLGVFEPLKLDFSALPAARARSLYAKLIGLDRGEGYAPEWSETTKVFPTGRLHALGWLAAGTVVENLPPERLRNHFFDPRTGIGLHAQNSSDSLQAEMLSVKSGISSVRQFLAGAAVDGNGIAAPDWLVAPEAKNELGLFSFLHAYEQAVRGEFPPQRETALAEALLCVGAMLAVLEEMGDPAFLHSDLTAAADDGGALAIAERFGRAGVPPAAPEPKDATSPANASGRRLRDLFADGQGGGLAERTAARCASPRHCYTTDAPALLAEVGRYGKKLVDYLFRGDLRLTLADSGHRLDVIAAELPLGSGRVTLIGEQPEGRRRVLRTAEALPTLTGATLMQFTISDAERADLHRLVVMFQGRDRQNEAIITSAQLVLARPSSETAEPAQPSTP